MDAEIERLDAAFGCLFHQVVEAIYTHQPLTPGSQLVVVVVSLFYFLI